MVIHGTIRRSTSGDTDVVDLTDELEGLVRGSGIKTGVVTVSVPGSTAAITTCEFEPGMLEDLRTMFEELVPRGRRWAHNATWGDANGHSHLRASLVGPSLSVPIVRGGLRRGTWQQVVLIDFDTKPRERVIDVLMVGEG